MESANTADLDPVERDILQALRADGRVATAELARTLGIAETTVRRKLRRLLQDGGISVKAIVNPLRKGKGVAVIVGLDVERQHLKKVAENLAARDFVESVYAMTGPYDLIAELALPTVEALSRFLLDDLSELDGVKDTETLLIGRVYKHQGRRVEAGGAEENG